ncbi:8223_t:CDS:2, partial [Racocetra fulgida]
MENGENTESDSDISDTEMLEKNAFINEEKAEAVTKSRQDAVGTIAITIFFFKDKRFDLESSDEESYDEEVGENQDVEGQNKEDQDVEDQNEENQDVDYDEELRGQAK